jgi:predicted TIM-barrel fold metal-dependent hydrolase
MTDRRAFLACTGAFLTAQAPENRLFRVDIHHHLNPPFFAEATKRDVPSVLIGWRPETSLADMEKAGTAVAVLSMPRRPSVYLGANNVEASRALARKVNEYMAEVRRAHPARFGFFAELPLPDVEGSVREAAYALDTLGADGVAVATSYGSKWLGDPLFAPLWEELNRRKALVFTHPLSNACCGNQLPGVADTVVEYGTDTTRTIASLVFSGAAVRHPDARFVFAHAGGTMPFLIERFRFEARNPKFASVLPNGVDSVLQRFYYDTAQASTAEAMGALRALIPATHVLFGTDFPYRGSSENVDGLATCGLGARELAVIARDNALTLIPRLRTLSG